MCWPAGRQGALETSARGDVEFREQLRMATVRELMKRSSPIRSLRTAGGRLAIAAGSSRRPGRLPARQTSVVDHLTDRTFLI
jgi:hypothetical protein